MLISINGPDSLLIPSNCKTSLHSGSSGVTPHTMAQSTCGPGWTIPTLEDTYELLTDHSARTVRFLHQQMANGNHLQDPWDEACTLRNAMSRTAHLFHCLWLSEPNPDRFENLRKWVFIFHTQHKDEVEKPRGIRKIPTEETS